MVLDMPARNAIKEYQENGFYHLYNRGVEKRQIFLDGQDYAVFLKYLKEYLLPKDELNLNQKLSAPNLSYKEKDKILKLLRLNNFADEIKFLAYCLLPNHFHFLIQQKDAKSIDKFMQSLCTRYTMYFNRKYKRVGSLFQAVYKAVLIASEEQFLHLSRYIHKQALALQVALQGETLQSPLQSQPSQPSSYPEYLGIRKTDWVHPEEVLSYFSNTNPALSYEFFVKEEDNLEIIQSIIIED
ncbi:hypothetical protein COU95_01825 [Candidatus Shapirobacteria bacterium CG10_big_fil_rev_8_21_14_0_10_40_9]|uniref:Transposase IS200-like domain-containing protein n=1 Tax=Candidatus Shapirobacteria bacterium CG10_big_fil_rev_8_21_14_0_10_40_9 TaxID=1974888 RepID=A0A2M8L3N2_9BACT|nr:MAG: hypothetical protein COU95_01825 [Candidatus Shapirobacteria bacterium CG10_big_fil_rev_8_21_14_0_10_40_9]